MAMLMGLLAICIPGCVCWQFYIPIIVKVGQSADWRISQLLTTVCRVMRRTRWVQSKFMGFKQRKLIKYSIPNGTLSISFVAAFSESYSGVNIRRSSTKYKAKQISYSSDVQYLIRTKVASGVGATSSIILYMSASLSFENKFFLYTLPVPYTSIYQKQYAKTNDLRLIVEIATKSNLRMFTDPKTNNLHFTCKLKGPQCLDVEAFLDTNETGYYFAQNCQQAKHHHNCQIDGALFRYLQIYNLLKLKRDDIQSFMIENNLMQASPSSILTQLSNSNDQYFFQKYISGQVELRRKLRKRFDNIVNIDIKKIGKTEEKQNDVGPHSVKKQKNVEPSIEINPTPGPKLKKEVVYFTEETTALKCSQAKKQESQVLYVPLPKMKKKIAKKKGKLQKNKIKRLAKRQLQVVGSASGGRESIFILTEDKDSKGEEIFIDEEFQQDLPELQVLNEHAEYLWSSSESFSQEERDLPLDIVQINREDYFKSLRNSTLKKSLQKESLTTLLFHNDLLKENYQ